MSPLRLFYIISFLAVLFGTVWGGSTLRNHLENNIITHFAHDLNAMVLHNFTKDFWLKYNDKLTPLPCANNADCPYASALESRYHRFFSGYKVFSYAIYKNNDAARSLFENKPFFNDVNTEEMAVTAFNDAKLGRVGSFMMDNYRVDQESYHVVRTFYPIIPNQTDEITSQHVPAILEVVYDVTPLWANAKYYHYGLVGGIITALVCIWCAMYYSTYRTEKLLTRQYEKNVDLIKGKATAEAENKAKSQFLANVSHELRTPLNAIIGFSEIIKNEVMGPINNQQYKDYVHDIHISGVHLLSLINDILDYSKAEADKLEMDMEDVDVTKTIKNSVRLVLPRAEEAGVTIESRLPDTHYILKTDGKRLKQVILNLLSNSVKFTDNGGKIVINSWHDIQSQCFNIEVSDTGVGIAPQDISKVMSTFGQVENKLSRKYEGTGLGLPLSKKFVELMGGSFAIESEQGVGTKVTISLPYSS